MRFKSFVSFAIAFFLVFALLALLVAQKNSIAVSLGSSNDVLLLEKKYYADLDLKEAFSQAFRLSTGSDEKQRSESASENLDELEAFAEDDFAKQGIIADLWFGSPGEGEERAILEKTVASKKPVACSHCFDFSAKTLDWDKKIVHKSIELVFDGRISRKGLAHTPTSAEWVGESVAFGATFYSPESNFAWISIAKEGFG